jgi:hypothetical protein
LAPERHPELEKAARILRRIETLRQPGRRNPEEGAGDEGERVSAAAGASAAPPERDQERQEETGIQECEMQNFFNDWCSCSEGVMVRRLVIKAEVHTAAFSSNARRGGFSSNLQVAPNRGQGPYIRSG